jgi:hypothetical protein
MSTCYAVPSPTFQPAMRLIAAITNANPAAVTTTFDHDYHSGLIVRLDIPVADGMQQANGLTGTITVTGSDTFTIDIDTTFFDVFAIPGSPSPHQNTCAQVVPIGEVNESLAQSTQNVLPL